MSSSDLSEIENYLYYPEMEPRRIYNLGLLKLIAVVLIALGLIGVYVSVHYAPVPIVKISDVENNILMNYATLYIEGYVVEPPRADVIGGKSRITIYVNDNSTPVNLAVYAYDPVATDILKQRKLPFFGDRVRLLVQLRVREDITYAYLQDVRGIWILSSPGAEGGEYVDSLNGLEAYKYVCVRGAISNPRNVSSGLLFYVTTGKGNVTVLVPNVLNHMYGDQASTVLGKLSTAGSPVDLCGLVYYYRGTSPEILVRRLEDIRLPPTPGFIEINIKDVKNYVGESVSFTGYLYAIRYDSASRIYYVEFRSPDEQVAVNVSMSRADLISLLDPAYVGWKSLVLINGTVESNTTVKYIEGRVVNRVEPLTVNVTGALSQPIGRPLKIPRARITSAQIVGSNWKIYVTDESGGTIAVFIPASTVSDLGIELPKVGAIVVVAGYRDVYRGEQEIVVVSKNGFVVQG